MSNQDASGEKTERATPKKLRDARKRGDVAKSRDVTSTLGLAFALVLLWFTFESNLSQLVALLARSLELEVASFDYLLGSLGADALWLFLSLSAIVLIPIALFGLLIEFLQTGPIFALEKVAPKLENLHPISGFKRMFSADNVMEVIKSLLKTLILFAVAYFVIRAFLAELLLLPESSVIAIIAATKAVLLNLFLWTLVIFLFIMFIDVAYTRYAFAKKMRMSLRDIKQEHKDSEGDPQTKGQRKQMHKEFAQESATESARSATVLVVNPTHVAIAIYYDKEDNPVPTVTGKGEDELARSMRDAANLKHVPVLRNERLARLLLVDVAEGDVIPRGLFEIVAEIILWASKTSDAVKRELGEIAAFDVLSNPPQPPGEDLTEYPPGFEMLQIFPEKQTSDEVY